MPTGIEVRPVRPSDYEAWLALWDGYNEFYGRVGAAALDPKITGSTWGRFFDPAEPCMHSSRSARRQPVRASGRCDS